MLLVLVLSYCVTWHTLCLGLSLGRNLVGQGSLSGNYPLDVWALLNADNLHPPHGDFRWWNPALPREKEPLKS